jgi:single-strand DNA-binding protein
MYVNKIFVLGNLTRDPELKALTNGGSIATFTVATNRTYKKADSTKAEETEFHSVIVFGKQAESCAQYLKKGSSAHIEGRIQTRTFEKDGVKHYRTEIIAERVQFGPRPNAVNAAGKDVAPENDPDQRPPSERNAGDKVGGKDKGSEPIPYPEEEDIDISSIPF